MDPIARQLNTVIQTGNPQLFEMLSTLGKNLYFPKGILTQGAEAKEKAYKLNATIGIATECGRTMFFPSVMEKIVGIRPEESLSYAPSFGIPALRKAWQESLRRKNPTLGEQTISLPVVTGGITHAISIFADLWVDPGDVVLFPDMWWGNYNLILKVRKGADIRHYPLFTPEGALDLDGFAEAVGSEARRTGKVVVFLNFPNNPTGYTPTETEGRRMEEILVSAAAGGARVIAVTDDAYFGLFFDPESMKESMFARLCGRHPRLLAVKLDGATKESYVWGLRVGFITYGIGIEGDPAPVYDALEKKTAGAVRGSISNASHLGQTLVLQSMGDEKYPREKEGKYEILRRRAQRVKEVLQDPRYREAWDPYPFNSGYFMCIRLKSVDAETLRVHLLDRYGVGLIAIGSRNLRIAFSCLEENDIPELFDTVLKGVNDLKA